MIDRIYQYTTKYNPFSLEKIIFDSILHINIDNFVTRKRKKIQGK